MNLLLMNRFQILALVSATLIILGFFTTVIGYMIADDPQYYTCNSKEGKWNQTNDTNYKAICNEVSSNNTKGFEIFYGGIIITIFGVVLISYALLVVLIDDDKNHRR